jgi:hypothetical protein
MTTETQQQKETATGSGEASEFGELLGVFLLMDCTEYEGCTPLHTFKHKEAAEALKSMSESHDEKKPRMPGCVDDSAECDAEWDAFNSAEDEWNNSHPIAKGFSGADSYCIVEVPFHA